MKQDGRKVQQIEPSLDDLGMADCDIDSSAQLFSVPGFPPVSWNTGPQCRSSNALRPKQLFQPFDYVVLVGVDRKHLAFAAPRELTFHFLDQCPLFRVGL